MILPQGRLYLPLVSGPLITADEFAALGAADSVVFDCRWYLGEPEAGRIAYRAAHIPGAHYLSLEQHLSGTEGEGRHPLPAPEAFAATMETFGVDPTVTVVAYDDRGGAIAARLWWMLTDQGHPSARVLDGGIQAWEAAGYEVIDDEPSPPNSGSMTARPWTGTVSRDEVAERSADTVVIDARSFERYAGFEEPIDPEAGHIPGAISVPLSHSLTSDLRFLPADELAARFRAMDLDERTVIAQCGSGVTACHNILAMELAGMPRPALYVGSWSDWSTSGLPFNTGPMP